MTAIKNYNQLAVTPGRKLVLDILSAGLSAIDTARVLEESITLNEKTLTIQGRDFDLSQKENVYVLGFGKASCRAAQTLERILKPVMTSGIVISNVAATCEVISTYHGSHPRPSTNNVSATTQLLELAQQATERDLVIVVVSGGGSALLCYPASECDQGQRLYDTFLETGGTIHELNTLRKHISELKGGGLAKALYPAEIVGLIFSDIPGGHYDMIASGPTYHDHSTVQDAQEIISRYNLGEYTLTETPKDERYFERVTNIPLVSNEVALAAMKQAGEAAGYQVIVLDHELYEPVDDLVKHMLHMADEPKTIVIAGGEPRLIVPKDATGVGGRNTHAALVALGQISETQIFASLASDGIDNCPAAGAISDTHTKDHAATTGADDVLARDNFDGFHFFEHTQDLIHTGPTETNVSDLFIAAQLNNTSS
jgi:glycerate-2-kinase